MGLKTIHKITFVLLLLLLAGYSNAQYSTIGVLGVHENLDPAELVYVLPLPDPLRIEALKEQNRSSATKALRYALVRPLSISPEYDGVWTREEGRKVWRVQLLSPGALTLGTIFSSFAPLAGVELYAYDPGMKTVLGPFGPEDAIDPGFLPVGDVKGQEIVIEMQLPPGMEEHGSLEISELAHGFHAGMIPQHPCPAGQFGCSYECEIDVACREGDGWDARAASVVRIRAYSREWNSSRGEWDYFYQYCSGTLVNTTLADDRPYILTAEHCINFQEGAEKSYFYFNYETEECFGETAPERDYLRGADLLAYGVTLDYSLVELRSAIPVELRPVYSGWDRSEFQTSSSTTIHHPWGDVKKISKDTDEAPSIPSVPEDVTPGLSDYQWDSYWWIREWNIGSTEGGSSGAPLFNQAGYLLGALSGGDAYCGDSIGYDVEAGRTIFSLEPNVDDYYTMLSMAWTGESGLENGLADWLDPDGSGATVVEANNPHDVGALQPAFREDFEVFPNPVRDILRIEAPAVGTGAMVRIFDTSGNMLLQEKLYPGFRVNLGNYPEGIYLVQIMHGSTSELHKVLRVE